VFRVLSNRLYAGGLRAVLTLLGFAVLASGQSIDANALLERATAAIENNAEDLPRFTCAETVERSFFRRPDSQPQQAPLNAVPNILSEAELGRQLASRDRLRLEVAAFNGKELYSWPGESRFESQDLQDMIGAGATSSGEFGSFAISVFLSDSEPALLRFRGVRALSGHRVAEYAYRVPLENSHYSIRMGRDKTVRTGYEGYFLVDADTADLRRLVVELTQPPADSGVLRGLVVIDYERQAVGGRTGLLPRVSVLRLLSDSGNLAVNRTTFGACRAFSSTSSLRSDMDPEMLGREAAETDQPEIPSALPAGLKVETVMMNPIDTQTSFAGDPLEARVVKAVTLDGRTLIAKGAVIEGRVVRVEQQFYPSKSGVLGLRFDYVKTDSGSIPISLAALGKAGRPGQASVTLAPREHRKHVATISVFGNDRIRLDTQTVMRWETR
jgi:hypothetical protein